MKKIKIGIFGCGPRGIWLAKEFALLKDCTVVAVCDDRPEREKMALEAFGKDCRFFSSFDEFIESGLDAVLLANLFYDHAQYAIKCLEKNIHVLSECISNGTMAEGVQLVRAAKKSKAIYMLLENYPQMIVNRDMQRVVAGGTLGKILYAEGEYNHPVNEWDTEFTKNYKFYPEHWRHFLPRTVRTTPFCTRSSVRSQRITAMQPPHLQLPHPLFSPLILKTRGSSTALPFPILKRSSRSVCTATECFASKQRTESFATCSASPLPLQGFAMP